MTLQQDELLEKEDPRFYSIDTKTEMPLLYIATQEKVKGTYCDFGLPSSAGLFLSLALKAHNKAQGFAFSETFIDHPPNGIWPDGHEKLFNYFEDMMAQIVFSHSAIEAFANISIPIDYEYKDNKSNKKCTETYNKDQIERSVSLEKKLDKVLPEIFEVKSPSNGSLWNLFLELDKIRHRIIHLKSIDTTSSGAEKITLWGDLLRNQQTDYSKLSHALMGHYLSKKGGSRWFKKFPY